MNEYVLQQVYFMPFDGVHALSLYNFRSYRFLELPITSRFVVLTGHNGAGKTNILEAISLFSSSRGLRKAAVNELVYNGGSSLARWNVNTQIMLGSNEFHLSTFLNNERRAGSIDGAAIASLAKFEEIIWILWITPQVDQIFLAQTPVKRKFFDHLATGIDPLHKSRMSNISKLQKERLHILQHNPDKIWLDTIENQLMHLYIAILNTRQKFIETISGIIKEYYRDIEYPIISCQGEFEQSVLSANEEDIETIILDKLYTYRKEDGFKNTTSYGPHKTNWEVTKANGISAENSSSGEQKSMLIVLILATLRLYQTLKSGCPILLLDDFMVHLDAKKRESFAQELQKLTAQVFLTGTDTSFFSGFQENAQWLSVRASMVRCE